MKPKELENTIARIQQAIHPHKFTDRLALPFLKLQYPPLIPRLSSLVSRAQHSMETLCSTPYSYDPNQNKFIPKSDRKAISTQTYLTEIAYAIRYQHNRPTQDLSQTEELVKQTPNLEYPDRQMSLLIGRELSKIN